MIKEYKELVYIQPTDIVIIEVLYSQGYGNWNIFAKSDRILPTGFYCKRFPWSENKYSLFERTVWAVYEACRSVHSLLRNNDTIVRTEMPIEDWIKAWGSMGRPTNRSEGTALEMVPDELLQTEQSVIEE